MTNMEGKAIQLLRENALRITPIRKQVLEIFLQAGQEALSNAAIEQHFENLDRITLYRTLRTFEDKGLIHQAIDGTGTPKFALCSDRCTEHDHQDNHAHFHCMDCGRTLCLEETNLPAVVLPEGYKIEEKHLVLSGKCDNCT